MCRINLKCLINFYLCGLMFAEIESNMTLSRRRGRLWNRSRAERGICASPWSALSIARIADLKSLVSLFRR